jgi:dynein heavy chain
MSNKAKANNKKNQGNYEQVKVNTINPKSLTIGRLYGDFDKISHDWTDGVLATVIKDCAYDKSLNRRWILLDGPVDAVWIENLNTVLDDNKKLCLSSGEIVKFTPKMTMMFEVEDLLEASPATVSRCGMVYLNPDKLGWNVQTLPWLISLPNSLKIEGRLQMYKELIDLFVPKVMDFLFGKETTLEEEKRLESLKTVI